MIEKPINVDVHWPLLTLTREDISGSNTTGFVAESLHRRWIALENVEEHLKVSKFRFEEIKEES